MERSITAPRDTNYFDIKLVREIENAEDVAVAARTRKNNFQIDRVAVLSVKAGIASLFYQDIPDTYRLGWIKEYKLPYQNIIQVGVYYSGKFEWYKTDYRRTRSEEHPWLFWLNSTNELKGQYYKDITSQVHFGSDVSRFSIGNILSDEVDLILIYQKINDNKYYYRIFNENIWQAETLIPNHVGDSDFQFIRSTDMRFGVVNGESNHNHFLSDRTWGGFSIPPESFALEIKNPRFEICPINYTPEAVQIVDAEIVDIDKIKVKFSYEITNPESGHFKISDTNVSTNVKHFNNLKDELLITLERPINLYADVEIEYYSGNMTIVLGKWCTKTVPFPRSKFIQAGLQIGGQETFVLEIKNPIVKLKGIEVIPLPQPEETFVLEIKVPVVQVDNFVHIINTTPEETFVLEIKSPAIILEDLGSVGV